MKFSVLLIFFSFHISLNAQISKKIEDIKAFQEHLNSEFSDPEESPLTKVDFEEFEKLEFFTIDTNYVVTAVFVRTPYEAPFSMPTTTDRKPVYVKYGEAFFSLMGKKYKLNIYQNQELTTKPEYENYLFLPFTDLTNGETSYGGGRYVDLRIPESNKIIIDFNKAYNPYCAYNGKYSCPIPPAENRMELKIQAGVKAFKL